MGQDSSRVHVEVKLSAREGVVEKRQPRKTRSPTSRERKRKEKEKVLQGLGLASGWVAIGILLADGSNVTVSGRSCAAEQLIWPHLAPSVRLVSPVYCSTQALALARALALVLALAPAIESLCPQQPSGSENGTAAGDTKIHYDNYYHHHFLPYSLTSTSLCTHLAPNLNSSSVGPSFWILVIPIQSFWSSRVLVDIFSRSKLGSARLSTRPFRPTFLLFLLPFGTATQAPCPVRSTSSQATLSLHFPISPTSARTSA
jgi:hypothetical protein